MASDARSDGPAIRASHKLSKQQIADLAGLLSYPYASVDLLCDGSRVTLQVFRAKGMTYRVMTFIDGVFEGKWTFDGQAHPQQKYLRKTVKPAATPAERKRAENALGKRYVQKSKFYSGSITYYMPDWASGKAALMHLCRVCESVEVLAPGHERAHDDACH